MILLQLDEVEDEPALFVERALDRHARTVVVPVQPLAAVPGEGDEVRRREDQIVLLDRDAELTATGMHRPPMPGTMQSPSSEQHDEDRCRRQVRRRPGIADCCAASRSPRSISSIALPAGGRSHAARRKRGARALGHRPGQAQRRRAAPMCVSGHGGEQPSGTSRRPRRPRTARRGAPAPAPARQSRT